MTLRGRRRRRRIGLSNRKNHRSWRSLMQQFDPESAFMALLVSISTPSLTPTDKLCVPMSSPAVMVPMPAPDIASISTTLSSRTSCPLLRFFSSRSTCFRREGFQGGRRIPP